MSTFDLEKKAKEAFIDDHFELAVDLYSQAIDLTPNNADLFVDRAQANIKLANFTEAVADANKAIELDPTMAKAYLRKGMACIKLEEYETAKGAFKAGATLAPGDSRFINLLKECDDRIGEAGELTKQQSVDKAPPSAATPAETPNVASIEAQPPSNAPNQGAVPAAAKPKYRQEFYQKPEEVVVTIFAKGIPKDHVTVDYGEQILSVRIEVPGEDTYAFQTRLFGKINPSKCRYDVMSTKIEIRLAKAEPIHWTSLEFTREATVVPRMGVPSVTNRPTYPSSKPTAVDWDKLEAQMKKEEKDEKLDGDAALNKFFRDIYGDADEDTRRAMMKSFVESNGTVLSTDWKEVGAKKIEGSPPDGMEMKKWEY